MTSGDPRREAVAVVLRDQIAAIILNEPMYVRAADAILALPAIASALAGRDAVLEEAARVAEADVPADCSYGPGMGIARNIRALATAPAPSGWRDVATDPPPKDGTRVMLYVVTRPDLDWADGKGWAYHDIGEWNTVNQEWEKQWAGEPTHWMPLPPLPAPPQEAAHDRD